MNDRSLKRLILKEIHSVLNEGEEMSEPEQSGDEEFYEVKIDKALRMLVDAKKMTGEYFSDDDGVKLDQIISLIKQLKQA